MLDGEAVLAKARELGALDAVIIPTSSIVVAHWVRLKCQYGCPDYGKWKTCPPYSPDPDTTSKVLAEYEKALLMKSTSHTEATNLAVSMMFWLYSQGIFKAFPMGSGRCYLCEECDPLNCRHPDKAYPSMEACGIDVVSTVKNAGWDNGPLEGGKYPHFCMVLLW
ncbi:MAG: hypothetical protein DRI93_05805 [Aquificota bacterium]|nr:MAG: hypothetical protein DRI93_05805 [Aquificota bacterium]